MRYQVTLSQRARPTRAWCGAMNQRAQAKTKTKNRNIPGIAHRTSSKVRRELRLCPTGLLMLRSVLRTDETNVLARYQVALSHPSHPSPRTNHHHHHHKKANRKTKPRRRRRHAKTKRVRVRMTLCRVFPSTSAPTYEYARRIGSSVRRLAIYAYSSPSPSTRDVNDAHAIRHTHLAQQRTHTHKTSTSTAAPTTATTTTTTPQTTTTASPRTLITHPSPASPDERHTPSSSSEASEASSEASSGVNDPSARSPHCAPRDTARQRARRRRRPRTCIERVRDRGHRRRIATTNRDDDDDDA